MQLWYIMVTAVRRTLIAQLLLSENYNSKFLVLAKLGDLARSEVTGSSELRVDPNQKWKYSMLWEAKCQCERGGGRVSMLINCDSNYSLDMEWHSMCYACGTFCLHKTLTLDFVLEYFSSKYAVSAWDCFSFEWPCVKLWKSVKHSYNCLGILTALKEDSKVPCSLKIWVSAYLGR